MAEISHFIAQYGYLAVFVLVFLQELGVPNPISNELVLLYAGYCAHSGTLNLVVIIAVSVAADFIGTSILYFVFYLFGNYITSKRPRWFPISAERMEKLKQRAYKGGVRTIFIGRLLPFVRGYLSVGAGIVQIKPIKFLSTVILSAITWSGGLVFVGWLIAPYSSRVVGKSGVVFTVSLVVTLIVAIYATGRYVSRSFFSR